MGLRSGMASMTKIEIDAVFERVRTWPQERQEDAAAMLLRMEQEDAEPYELTDEELADVEEAERQAERGEFASDEEMTALFDKYRG